MAKLKFRRATVVKRSKIQTGRSIKKVDNKRSAHAPGIRRTSNPHKHHGKTIRKNTTYKEIRRNRSDKSKKNKPKPKSKNKIKGRLSFLFGGKK